MNSKFCCWLSLFVLARRWQRRISSLQHHTRILLVEIMGFPKQKLPYATTVGHFLCLTRHSKLRICFCILNRSFVMNGADKLCSKFSSINVVILRHISFFLLWRWCSTLVMASSFLRFLDHTQRRTTFGRTPLDEWSARLRDLYLTIHNTHKRQTSMPPVGFEPTISEGERPQTYALDRAATGTGVFSSYKVQISVKHNYLSHKIFLWQHVSALLSRHQAFQSIDPMYQKF